VIFVEFREVKEENAELSIPEPGFRLKYYGHVVRVERVIPRVKPFKIKGHVRYGTIQIILPKQCVDKPAYVIVYVLTDKEQLMPSYRPPETIGRTLLEKVVS
jgi:hypothetical protein